MCDLNETPVTEQRGQRSVEEMLHEIAYVLRLTRQVKAELRAEQVERETARIEQRTKASASELAVSM